MEVTKHENGKFCWAELSTSDGAGAKAFYTSLLGWDVVDNPMGEGMVYTMLTLHGKPAAALYEDHSGKAPPHWGTYISADDLDATTKKATDLGATVLAGPFDVMEHGRMAAIQDPTGAVFCLWQPKNHIGYQVVFEPGSVAWNELYTRDASAAEAFYSSLLGYGVKHSNMPMPYTEFQLDGKSIAGMMAMGPEMEGIPPHWNIYFTVANCQETVDKATVSGGTTLMGPMPVPDVGTIAIVRDPQGAVFGIVG